MQGQGSGTQTAGIVSGGDAPPVTAATEEYDGTSWTNATSSNTARKESAMSKNGTQSDTTKAGGDTGSLTTAAESYNGTSWTSIGSIITAGDNGAGAAGGPNMQLINSRPASAFSNRVEELTPEQVVLGYKTLTSS